MLAEREDLREQYKDEDGKWPRMNADGRGFVLNSGRNSCQERTNSRDCNTKTDEEVLMVGMWAALAVRFLNLILL